MRRGEVWWVDLDPARSGEADRRRPAILVSNDSTNRVVERLDQGVVTVVPLTTNVRRILSFQVLIPASAAGLSADSKAQAEQVRSVSHRRLHALVGRLPTDLLAGLDEALRSISTSENRGP